MQHCSCTLNNSPVSSPASFYYCNLSSKVCNFQPQGTIIERIVTRVTEKLKNHKTTEEIAKAGSHSHPSDTKRSPGATSTQWKLGIETQHGLSVGRRATRHRNWGEKKYSCSSSLLPPVMSQSLALAEHNRKPGSRAAMEMLFLNSRAEVGKSEE